MTREEGLRQIDGARWTNDGEGCLDMVVQGSDNLWVHAWLTMRQPYCDRGHVQLNIGGPLTLGLDDADSFPRYFFSFAEADAHTRTFLKWRLWQERTHPLEALRAAFAVDPPATEQENVTADSEQREQLRQLHEAIRFDAAQCVVFLFKLLGCKHAPQEGNEAG